MIAPGEFRKSAAPGFREDWPHILEALYDLRASRLLPDDEKGELERLIVLVEETVYPR